MLYDPKWEVKANPISLESLVAWLEKRPADGTYDECNHTGCMIAQWLYHVDPASRPGFGHSFMYVVNGRNTDFRKFSEIVFRGERTFGAALDRARAAL
jgi:hypothetical protein